MGQLVGGPQSFGGHVCVALGSRKARVAKYFLDRTQVGAARQQVRGGGVAQAVGSDVIDPCELAQFVNGCAHLPLVNAATALPKEERAVRGGVDQLRATALEPLEHRVPSRHAERNHTFFGTLTEHANQGAGRG